MTYTNKLIVVYTRVSSAAQSLELQESAAKRYLESINLSGDEESVVFLSDHDVSATKLKMGERPNLAKLISLIEEGKVQKVVIYKRDRLARNFYEYVDIANVFIENNVDVVYTGGDEPPFNKKLSIESFYGIFGQIEGKNIRTRTDDARKQYPSNLFGYTRIKENEQVRYDFNEDKEDVIHSLFEDFSKIQNSGEFLSFILIKRPDLTNPEKVFRILANPFYAGHSETKNGYQKLAYVTPIIDLDLFQTCKDKLDEYYAYYLKALDDNSNSLLVVPYCEKCGCEMKHRKENALDIGYFMCRQGHKRLSITVDELNSLVTQLLLEHIQSISSTQLKNIVSKRILAENKRLQKELEIAKYEILDDSLTLSTIGVKGKTAIPKLLAKIQSVRERCNDLEQDLRSLQNLTKEIAEIQFLLSDLTIDFVQDDLQRLSKLLIDKVIVHESFVHAELFLSSFVKEGSVS